MTPPRLASWILSWWVPRADRDELLGDLQEQFIQRALAGGRSGAARWYWRQTVHLIRRWRPSVQLTDVSSDVRFALRLTRRSPGFAGTVVFTLALGIAATTSIYSVVYGVLLRPLPVADETSIAIGYATEAGISDTRAITYPAFQAWRSLGVFDDLAGVSSFRLDLIGSPGAERVEGAQVTDNFFSLLGAQAALGRVFTAADRSASETPAVISHTLWRRRFNAAPEAVGALLKSDTRQLRVIGIMPPGFEKWRGEAHIWVPIERETPAEILASPGYSIVVPVGRLRAGSSIDQAAATLAQLDPYSGTRMTGPPSARSAGKSVRLLRLRDDLVPAQLRRLLAVLFVAVVLTWLVVCANTSVLLMARGTRRAPELAVRLAVGATRGRIVRQLLVESVVLALPGGAIGATLAFWLLRGFVAFGPPSVFDAGSLRFDMPIVTFSLAMTIVTAVVFGVVPARRASRVTLQTAMGERGGAGDTRLSKVLIAAEMATALVVLVGAALLVKSVRQMDRVPLGFDPAHVLTTRVILPLSHYGEAHGIDDARYLAPQRELLARLGSLPGVEGATIGGSIFSAGSDWRSSVWLDDGRRFLNGNRKDKSSAPRMTVIGPDYMRVHGVRMVMGREFRDADDFGAPRVVLVNETLARLYWPHQNPVGKRVIFDFPNPGEPFKEPWAEVIGVVSDVRHAGVDTPVAPGIYRAAFQYARRDFEVMIRASMPFDAIAASVREQVQAVDPSAPLFSSRRLADDVADATATTRYSSTLLSLLAAITAFLCGGGVFSVLAHGVASRRRELGIRVALGADRRRLAGDVLRQVWRLLGLGLGAGLLTALLSSRLLVSLLFDVSPLDPSVMIGAVLTVVVIALGAAYVPARRAAGVDPIVALRSQ